MICVELQMNNFLNGKASDVAPMLLGCVLERTFGNRVVRVRIVETEAYDQMDVASHSYKGRTPRTDVMFGEAGMLYVYFTYGMHYCCNIVVGPNDYGAAVLIRAVEPIEGREILEKKRGKIGAEATNGPAKLCQALEIDKRMNGHNLNSEPLRLIVPPDNAVDDIIQTTRIGISKGSDVLWRFYIANNPYVSKF
jgi:DNA-3-methyladenine glycosylase